MRNENCDYCQNGSNDNIAFKGYRTVYVCNACAYVLSLDGYTVTDFLGQKIY